MFSVSQVPLDGWRNTPLRKPGPLTIAKSTATPDASTAPTCRLSESTNAWVPVDGLAGFNQSHFCAFALTLLNTARWLPITRQPVSPFARLPGRTASCTCCCMPSRMPSLRVHASLIHIVSLATTRMTSGRLKLALFIASSATMPGVPPAGAPNSWSTDIPLFRYAAGTPAFSAPDATSSTKIWPHADTLPPVRAAPVDPAKHWLSARCNAARSLALGRFDTTAPLIVAAAGRLALSLACGATPGAS